jgi:hypothetical protein
MGIRQYYKCFKSLFWKRIKKGFSKYGTNVMDMWAGQEKTEQIIPTVKSIKLLP